MIALLNVARQRLADVLRFVIVALRPTRVVAAENLFLRRQLAMYLERGVKPRRPDSGDPIESRPAIQVLRLAHFVRQHGPGPRDGG